MNVLLIVCLFSQTRVINYEQRVEIIVPHTADPDDEVIVLFDHVLNHVTGYSIMNHGKVVFHDLPDREGSGMPVRPNSANQDARSMIRVQYLDSRRLKVIIPHSRLTSDLNITVLPGKMKMRVEVTTVTKTVEEN
jgi:hypothetical protein